MKHKRMRLWLAALLCIALALPAVSVQAATTITSNQTGNHDGYDYEFWKDSGGSGSMTLNSGGTFSAQWSNINNILFRKGKKFNETQTHQQIGTYH
ncbi:glycoside hydrolase family 11 protein [Paenibacillus sambharensis]|uniref:glycoside hydrolase family 11 protein n=1 Tax=Paenibacillus sambharensis TaxID=1803190 RepID=UPI002482D1FD|nr:glycoside hydrolase family 11 protein [Paenibacillus sambharensis]